MAISRAFGQLGTVLSLFIGVTGCHRDDSEPRAEAGQLAHAIRMVRRAPHDQKRAPLELLEKVPCTSERCEARERCVEAYRAHLRGVEGLGEARRALSGSDAPVTGSAASLLSKAQEDLEKSVALAKTCADLEAELTRRYGLE